MTDVVIAFHDRLYGFGCNNLSRCIEVLVCHHIDILCGQLFSSLFFFIRETGAAFAEALELADVVADTSAACA